jgi:phage shock protein A
MTGSKLFGLVLAIAALGTGAYFLFPGFRAKVDKEYAKIGEWTPEARRNDPVGYIEYSITKLNDNIGKFEDARAELVASKTRLEQDRKKNRDRLDFAEKSLGEFKKRFAEVKEGKAKWPVEIAAKPYSEAELRNQVSLMLTEKEGFNALSKQHDTALANADKYLNDLVARITDSKGKLSILQSQKEIVKISKLTAETEKTLNDVQDVLVRNEALASGHIVRSVDELMKESGAAAAPSANPQVEAFLNG